MKPIFTAILEAIVLFVSIGLVFLAAKLFGYESPYNDFKEKYPDTVITVSSAIGAVPDGIVLTPEEASVEVGKYLFGTKSDKKIPMPIAKLLCMEIGEDFDVREWNVWARSSEESKLAFMNGRTGWVDPPPGEEVRDGDTREL